MYFKIILIYICIFSLNTILILKEIINEVLTKRALAQLLLTSEKSMGPLERFVKKRSRVRISTPFYSTGCPTWPGEWPELLLVRWIIAGAKKAPGVKVFPSIHTFYGWKLSL